MHTITRRRKSERASIFTEFALVCGIFSMIILGGLMLLRSVYAASVIRSSTVEGVRAGILGLSVADIESVIISRASREGVGLTTDQIKICPLASPDCATESTGGPNAYMRVTTSAGLTLFPGVNYSFSSTIQGKNEP